jgi:hypothetical protein
MFFFNAIFIKLKQKIKFHGFEKKSQLFLCSRRYKFYFGFFYTENTRP